MITRDVLILAKTIYGEARGEILLGQYAVAHVVLNRKNDHRWHNMSLAGICLQRAQFSCWLPSDPSCAILQNLHAESPRLAPMIIIAQAVIAGTHDDPTHGATHYHAVSIDAPRWARGKTPCARIGHHLFYRDIA